MRRRPTLLAAAGLAVLATPLLAGMGGAGGWSIGIFAVIFAGRYLLTTDPESWSHPAIPAAVAALNAAAASGLWLAGRGLSVLFDWRPGWGALPPILLALAATALSWQMWSARQDRVRQDGALNRMLRDVADPDRDHDRDKDRRP